MSGTKRVLEGFVFNHDRDSIKSHEVEFGDPRLPDRYWAKVTPVDNGCWTWGASRRNDYGCFWLNGKSHRAHRLAFQSLVAPIVGGMHCDHLCRDKACVRPSHIELVTCRENVLRGVGLAARNSRKTRCDRGHIFTDENTGMHGNDKRYCKKCSSDRTKAIRVDLSPDERVKRNAYQMAWRYARKAQSR